MFDPFRSLQRGTASQLSKLLSLNSDISEAWTDGDIRDMFRRQMAAPLDYDVSRAECVSNPEGTRKALAGSSSRNTQTLADILSDPLPHLELLVAVKDLFKGLAGRASSEGTPEQQIAYVLYLIAVAVADMRLGQRITRLDNRDMLQGIEWALGRKWLDHQTKKIFFAAKSSYTAKEQSR